MNTVERPTDRQDPGLRLVRRILLALVGTVGLLLTGTGVFAVVMVASDFTAAWGLIGLFFSLVYLAAGVALLAPAVAALLMMRKHSRGEGPTCAILGVITAALALLAPMDGIWKLPGLIVGVALFVTSLPLFDD